MAKFPGSSVASTAAVHSIFQKLEIAELDLFRSNWTPWKLEKLNTISGSNFEQFQSNKTVWIKIYKSN
jgi:hypothetical protein